MLNNINYNRENFDLEPFVQLRGHTGPLFCLEADPWETNIIYTAGNEGIIKIWKVPKPSEVNQYGDSEFLFNCNIGFFEKPNEIIWDLKHHPTEVIN